jgi:hypothetical protein
MPVWVMESQAFIPVIDLEVVKTAIGIRDRH